MNRRVPLRRGEGPKRRTPLRQVSERRRLENRTRREVVRPAVLVRDGGCAAEGIPGVPHGPVADRVGLEVHELACGSGRSTAWLDADRCVALCPAAHDFATDHPTRAQLAGLAVPAWADDGLFREAARIRGLWRAGRVPPLPSWFAADGTRRGGLL